MSDNRGSGMCNGRRKQAAEMEKSPGRPWNGVIGKASQDWRPGEQGGASDGKGGVRVRVGYLGLSACSGHSSEYASLYLKSSRKPLQGVSPSYNMMLLC